MQQQGERTKTQEGKYGGGRFKTKAAPQKSEFGIWKKLNTPVYLPGDPQRKKQAPQSQML